MNTNMEPGRGIIVALAGNPNAGKTTLFNHLTGLRHKVGNYPGVTVEWRRGRWRAGSTEAQVVDLPGIYSLEAGSVDETIATDALKGNIGGLPPPDAVIVVVDSTNLERNLYLVTQLFELGRPIVVALTMIDLAEANGETIDTVRLSGFLKAPVVKVNASTGSGMEDLAAAVNSVAGSNPSFPVPVPENAESNGNALIFARYRFIANVVQESVRERGRDAHAVSDKIDGVLTHRVFGLIILLAVLLAVFQTIFSFAALPMDLLEKGFGSIGGLLRTALPEGMFADLMVDGIIAGVGSVLIFLPQIALLFLFISILEDSGYMARAAFILDKLMGGVGLHGKAFLPLISSFACAIPGIMATRTIEDTRDRIATIMIAPFMSCSARLPVYTLMIGAFFAAYPAFGFISVGAVMMLSMYLLGIVVAIVVAFVLKRTVLKAPPPPFIMEMPPYRMPDPRTVIQNIIERSWLFVKRAGTVILAISIVLWALAYFPRSEAGPARYSDPAAAAKETTAIGDAASATLQTEKGEAASSIENSYAGMLGRAIEPVIEPLGFDWKIGIALIASFAAREVLVSTLSIIYNVGGDADESSESLLAAIRNAKRDDGSPAWTPLTAFTLMVFFVLAMQCMSTVAVVRRETNSWRWPLFMVAYMTLLAYAGALLTYQGGRLLGFG
ncbi:MAG TPA: ferrous iron transport protein B [Pyrinomonadaceae bacterium]|nr:ferrous iron transport protein B [Pyrinomonadaceae bacterium]